ncbi:MAG TPA: DGQHR domain-containing protein [Caulobacteraceae bacterium]|jgi:DGQHR domain-containing protein|nr:DGQHR domain-containing protein [Caulobacteraceae bacterium]
MAAAKSKSTKSAPKKPSKSPLTREQKRDAARKKNHPKYITELFEAAGFTHVKEMTGKDIVFNQRSGEIDELYISENVVILLEHTSHNEDNVAAHLVKKKIIFDYISADNAGFVAYLKATFPNLSAKLNPNYQDHHYRVCIVYASLEPLKDSTKLHVQNVKFLDYPPLRYFRTLSQIIRASCKYEVLSFLDISPGEFGARCLQSQSKPSSGFAGSVLPETQSHFPPGYKVASFYVSAAELIQRSYVLRRDTWREGANIYQRMIQKRKIESLRRHLLEKKGAFINNIIVTLPESTKMLNEKGDTIDTTKINSVELSHVQLPDDFNSIGIIDGQHRVFSYYEGGADEVKISPLRTQQNLLVTGIIFPPGLNQLSRDSFAARLFLDINGNQTKVNPALIQEIGIILKPYAVHSIARSIIKLLNEKSGPFNKEFETAFSDGPKIKTTSVVNYGLVPLVRISSPDSLFSVWKEKQKDLLKAENDLSLREEYVKFCAKQVSDFAGAIRANVEKGRWTADRNAPGAMLTTVIVNGMIHCLIRLSSNGAVGEFDYYRAKLEGVGTFDFKPFVSNQYNQLGDALASKYFGISKP